MSVAGGAGAQLPAVVNNPPPDPDAPAFRLSATPIFRIGGLNDDSHYELPAVSDADLTSDGRLLVAVRATRPPLAEVRVFGPGNKFERTIGRWGDGPGEFRQVGRVWQMAGDSIAVYDDARNRLHIFDAMGRHGRQVQQLSSGIYGGRGPLLTSMCCMDDWTSLKVEVATRGASAPSVDNPKRDSISVSFAHAGAEAPRGPALLLEWSDPVVTLGGVRRAGARGGTQGGVSTMVPFGRQASLQISGAELIYGLPDSFEYRVYGGNGVLKRIVRTGAASVLIPESLNTRIRESLTSSADEPDRAKSDYDKLKRFRTLSAYGRILTERDGTVWVENLRTERTDRRWWAKFGGDGKLIGTLVVPTELEVVKFARGNVIFQQLDENRLATLKVFRIEPVR